MLKRLGLLAFEAPDWREMGVSSQYHAAEVPFPGSEGEIACFLKVKQCTIVNYRNKMKFPVV